jgi:type I restriction enzyme, S subunit
LMALCDRLEAQQQEREKQGSALARASLARFADAPTPANLQFLFDSTFCISPSDLRKPILTLAVKGKLVPQDPNDEPAEESVERVRKDAKKAIRDGIIRRHALEEIPDDADLEGLPLGWRWTRLVEATRPVQYAIKRGPFGSAIRKDMFVPTGFKVYEQQHAISGDFTKGRYYINEAKFGELSAFELNPGEILVSCSGTVGKVAIVPEEIERGIINQALLKLSLHQSALLNEYFLILFPAFFMETETLMNLSGTAQKNIPGMEVLKAMPFPLPPLAEQRRIVAKVEQLMALVDALEAQLATSRATAADLLSALVAELTTA